MTKILGYLVVSFSLGLLAYGDPEQPKFVGSIILVGVAGYAPANISFTDIQWVTNDGGIVIDGTGSKVPFLNQAIRKVVYYDSAYYGQLDQRGDWFTARFGIKKYEITVNKVNAVDLTIQDLDQVQQQKASLDTVVQAYPTANAVLGSPIATLGEAITHLSAGDQKINGQWMTPQEIKTRPPPPSVGQTIKSITFKTKSGKQYANVTASPTDTGLSLITSDGGATISFDELPDDYAGLPKGLVQQILTLRLESLLAYASGAPSTAPERFKEKEYGSSFLSVFISESKIIGKQSKDFPEVQKKLSGNVIETIEEHLNDPNDRTLVWSEWPKLHGLFAFTLDQQISFYKTLFENQNMSLRECREILARANSPDSPTELKQFVASWSEQAAQADKLQKQIENALGDFFSDQTNGVILKKSATKGELTATLHFETEGDAASKAITNQIAVTSLPCIKSMLQSYENCWPRLTLIQNLRIALSNGRLSDIERLSSALSPDPSGGDLLSPNQKLVADACANSLELFESQKTAAQKLLDDAERLRTLGGQNSKALQDYKDAYQLDNDPGILGKIKDLNKESLGL